MSAEPPVQPPKSMRRAWWGLAALIAVLVLFASWWWSGPSWPEPVRLAGGAEGGSYHRAAEMLARRFEAGTGRRMEVLSTTGSIENRETLLAGDVQFALQQTGAASTDGLRAVAPLYAEPVFLVVRKQSGIGELADLVGKRVAVGVEGSGTLASASLVLEHFGLQQAVEIVRVHYDALREDDSLDAALVTSGLLNPAIEGFFSCGQFDALPIPDAPAVALRHASFSVVTVPRGVFRASQEGALDPPIPSASFETIAATAWVACLPDSPGFLIEAALAARFSSGVRHEFPELMTRADARDWTGAPNHDSVEGWHDPFGQLDAVSGILESLSAAKELLVALGLLIFLLWKQLNARAEQERLRLVQEQKDYLDTFLEETIRIEAEQAEASAAPRLRELAQELAAVKRRALGELTSEELRGDQTFAIFLDQCDSVRQQIQARLPRPSV